MATTLTRSNQSTTTKKVDTFTFGDWSGTFTYESAPDATPASVQVTATKGTVYFNGQINLNNPNISFSGGPFDGALVATVVSEVNSIISPST